MEQNIAVSEILSDVYVMKVHTTVRLEGRKVDFF